MEIAGLIKDFAVETLLEQAEAEEQTGVLFLKSDRGIGEVSFENGLIYSADSPFVREKLGHKLVSRGLIYASELYQALRDQERNQEHLLGEILFRKKLLSSERVKKIVKEQIEEAVLHLLIWDKGQFTFERSSCAESHQVYIRPKTLLKEKKGQIERLKTSSSKALLERIEDHPSPGIHNRLHQEITHTITRAKTFEPRVMILVVEGDAKWRMMVQDELAKQNFHIKGVSHTDKAKFEIERMVEKGYNPIVITDIDFPHQPKALKLEGLSFMEDLHETYPEIPILVSTSYPISNLRRKILLLGGIFCLVKPDLSILSAKNFEQIFQAFMRELVYCLDRSIHQYYQDYFHERAEIVKNDLIEDLYHAKTELIRLGDQVIEDSRIQETFYSISNLLAREGNVDRAIEVLMDFMVGRYDHAALFLWGKKYLNGYIGRSKSRADFSDRVQTLSVDVTKIPVLKKLHEDKTILTGAPPGEGGYVAFLDKFLDKRPRWHLLYPVEVMGQVVALWYADRPQLTERDPYAPVLVALINMIVLSLKIDIESD